MEMKRFSHKVGVNVHHLEWCTKYRYKMFSREEFKNICENAITRVAERHGIVIRVLNVQPEHAHVSCECPPSMSQSRALMLLKGGSSYLVFREIEKFRLRYPKGHLWSPGAYAGSVGYNTVDIVDNYVRYQDDTHQKKLTVSA